MKHEFVYVNEYRVELDYSVETNLKSFKEEAINRLHVIHKEHSINDLLFSGGMDSSFILMALQDLGISPQLHSLSFSKEATDSGSLLVKEKCKQLRIKEPKFFYVDKDAFFEHIKILIYEKGIGYPNMHAYYMDYYLSKMEDKKFYCGMGCEYRTTNGIVTMGVGPAYIKKTHPNRLFGFECSETFLAYVNDPLFKANYLKPNPIIKTYGDNLWYIRDLIYNKCYPELGLADKLHHEDSYIGVPYREQLLPQIQRMYPLGFLMKPFRFDAKEYFQKKDSLSRSDNVSI